MRRMKFFAAPALLALLVLFAQCDKKLIRIQHDINAKPITFELPAIPVAGPFDFTQMAKLDLQSQLDSLNIKLFDLTSITVRNVIVTITDSSSVNTVTFNSLNEVNFSFIDEATIEHTLAYKSPVPADAGQTLALDVNSDLNLLPYANGSDIFYHIKG